MVSPASTTTEISQTWLARSGWKWHASDDATPSEPQAEFMRDWVHDLLVFLGGFGTGKTHCVAHKAVMLRRVNRGTTGGAVGQSYKALKQDLIPAIHDVLDWNKIRHTYNASDFKFFIKPWRSTIQCVSAHEPDALKGQNWADAVGNEPGLWPAQSYLNLLSRIRVPCICPQVALGGTPEGYGWLYKYTEKAYGQSVYTGRDPYCRLVPADTRTQAHWNPDNYAKILERTYSADLIEEKLAGKFTAVGSGRAYHGFNRHEHVLTVEQWGGLQPSPIILCLDFGSKPAVAVMHQRIKDPLKGEITVAFDEIFLDIGDIPQVMDEFLYRYGRGPDGTYDTSHIAKYGLEVVGDATGTAKLATGEACYDIVFQKIRHVADWVYRTPDANPPVSDRVAIANGAFEHGRYLVVETCDKLIDDFEQVLVIPGTRQILKDKNQSDLTHVSDASTYDVHEFYHLPELAEINVAGRLSRFGF